MNLNFNFLFIREILKYDFNISRIKLVQHRELLFIPIKLFMNIFILIAIFHDYLPNL